MIKNILFFLFLIKISLGQDLLIQNGSFEGPNQPNVSPPNWTPCMPGQTPDTQPGSWGVDIVASEGNSYLGLVHNVPTNWQEGASQQLLQPMVQNIQYNCSIDLSGHLADESNAPVELVIWGGFNDCPQNELLWSSGDVPDFVWTSYSIQFTPNDNYTHIMLQINALTEISTYILVDNFNCENLCPEPLSEAGENQNLTCDNFINLSANEPISSDEGGEMIGEWSIISGNGNFSSIFDPNTLVTNLQEGENVFQWTLSNECGSSSDNVVINYSQDYNFYLPNQVYCLSSFELQSSAEGTWIVDDPLNMDIENPNNPNTIATPSSYGDYIFSFESCGDIVFSQLVNVIGSYPIITGNVESSCLEPISLNVDILGDPGYWDYQGPGEVVFSDIFSLNPTISVENYGTYTFTYFGCGLNNSITVNFNTENPIINPQETIFCSYEATLEAYSDNPQGWTFISGPNNSSVLIENPNSEITNVQVSEYGLYQFMFEGCGGNDIIDLLFEPIPPTLIASEHEDCLLESNLFAFNQGDDQSGPWEQISGPSGVLIESPFESNTTVIVPEYGIYEFSYPGCDSFSTIEIGFSCSPEFPNVFTPNDDGNNDFFEIKNLTIGNYSESLLTVYNRWGQIIYLAKDYGLSEEEKWWDGKTTFSMKPYSGISADRDIEANQIKEVNDCVYYYVFDVYNIAHDQPEKYTGYVTIIK
ncbi:MAG: gliding motility-associated C-terminal domain-containing protein [Bacteroidota bacterium]|nr:gliding motility-associated C-terminal domain-containing protein [Bacteroidota bacterium]